MFCKMFQGAIVSSVHKWLLKYLDLTLTYYMETVLHPTE